MSATDLSLEGAYRKLGRAKEHADALWAGIVGFLQQQAQGGFTDERNGYVVTLKAPDIPSVPPEISLLLGDTVQNMRAALDYLVYQLAKLDDPGVDHERTTMFPVFTTSKKFKDSGRKRIKMLSAPHQAQICALQPYHRGNRADSHPLARLIDLSDQDKHRLLIPTAHQVAGRAPVPVTETKIPGFTVFMFDFEPLVVEAYSGPVPPLNVEMEAHATISITLDDGTRLKELRKIGQIVGLILDSFDGDFPTAAATSAPVQAADWSYPLKPLA